MSFKRLKLNVSVEDDYGQPINSRSLMLDWTDNMGEVQCKMLVNFTNQILEAKYGRTPSREDISKLRRILG